MSFFKILFIFTFCLLSSLHAHKCVHNQMDFPLQKTPGYSIVDNYENLSMAFDYTNIESANPEIQAYIKDILLPPVESLILKSLKVGRYSLERRYISKDMCNGIINIPASALNIGYEADTVIFVATVNDPSADYLTKSMSCAIDAVTNRPTIGIIIFNTALMKLDMKNTMIESDILTVLHEFVHILGFSKALYPLYVDPISLLPLTGHVFNKTVNGVSTMILDLKPLTQRLRAHFKCPTLEGAYLENEGGADSFGAHFERRIFYNEIMTADNIMDAKFSEFTLALLEGTGWYKPNYWDVEKMTYGRGQGCKFFETKCIDPETKTANFQEFCSPLTQLGVSWTKRSFGVCGTAKPETSSSLVQDFDYWGNNTVVDDEFADNCPQVQPFKEFDCEDVDQAKTAKLGSYEYYGVGAKAFIGTLSLDSEPLSSPSGFCFKTLCTRIRDDYSLMVQFNGGGSTYCSPKLGRTGRIYPEAFEFPNNMTGYLECPDPYEFCEQVRSEGVCKNGCFRNGQCLFDECKCADGWGSYNCARREMVDQCRGCWYNDRKSTCFGNECICNPSNITCQCLLGLKTGKDCPVSPDKNNEDLEDSKSYGPTVIFGASLILLVVLVLIILQKKQKVSVDAGLSRPILFSNENNHPHAQAQVEIL